MSETAALNDDFAYAVLSAVAEIPEGKVATYGQIARLIGYPKNARLVARAFEQLVDQFERGDRGAYYIGQVGAAMEARPVKNMFDDLDLVNRRPFHQWWLDLVPVQRIVSLQNPGIEATPIPIDDPIA